MPPDNTVKNPTAWQPQNGKGYIVSPGQEYLITNNNQFIVTNDNKFIVTNGSYVTGLNPTTWTEAPAS